LLIFSSFDFFSLQIYIFFLKWGTKNQDFVLYVIKNKEEKAVLTVISSILL